MASASVEIRLSEMKEFRQLMWELRRLESDMRVGSSPFAERLERALDRFSNRTDRTERSEDR